MYATLLPLLLKLLAAMKVSRDVSVTAARHVALFINKLRQRVNTYTVSLPPSLPYRNVEQGPTPCGSSED